MEKKIYKTDLIIENIKGEKEGKQYDFNKLYVVVDDIKLELYFKEKLGSTLLKRSLISFDEIEDK